MNYPENGCSCSYPRGKDCNTGFRSCGCESVVNRHDYGCRSYGCLLWAIGFLGLLIAFALGLILGAALYATFLPVLASIIAFEAAIVAIAVALLIYYLCRRSR